MSQLISANSGCLMWGSGPAFQRVQPAESWQRARLPAPQSIANFYERHHASEPRTPTSGFYVLINSLRQAAHRAVPAALHLTEGTRDVMLRAFESL